MIESSSFLKSILDSVTAHITVIDKRGTIQYVNQSWEKFAQNNDHVLNTSWNDVNYLDTCDKAALMGDELAQQASSGIRKVINNEQELFYIEYPCHSSDEERWFIMRVTKFQLVEKTYFVLSHYNITERKLAEEKVLNLSRFDGLTNIPNRKYFDDFFHDEWNRCIRLNMPITLVLIDVDDFKEINDTYGHLSGDESLKKIANLLKSFAKRPSDICARYGGDEFTMVFGNTDLEISIVMMNKLLDAIHELKIPNINSTIMPTLTASIGLATIYPDNKKTKEDLIQDADKALYISKKNGGNQVSYLPMI
jgi:diguanylate cyclase (GGDEF)-like protein